MFTHINSHPIIDSLNWQECITFLLTYAVVRTNERPSSSRKISMKEITKMKERVLPVVVSWKYSLRKSLAQFSRKILGAEIEANNLWSSSTQTFLDALKQSQCKLWVSYSQMIAKYLTSQSSSVLQRRNRVEIRTMILAKKTRNLTSRLNSRFWRSASRKYLYLNHSKCNLI